MKDKYQSRMLGISLGIDIGGTHVKGVIVHDGSVAYELTRETGDERDDWQQVLAHNPDGQVESGSIDDLHLNGTYYSN